MKNLTISMLAIASIFCSCSKESDLIDGANPNGNNEKVEIKLNAGVVTTKAPIESDASSHPTKDVRLQIVTAPDAAEAVWTAITSVASTPTLKTTGSVDFTGTTSLYYNADETNKSHLLAYSPEGDNTTAGSVTWTIDGSKDIIVAPAVSGSKNTPVGALAFEHLLTQLQIEVKGDAAATQTFGTTIKSIKVKDALTKPSMTFTSAKVTTLNWANTTDKATFDVFSTGTDTPISSAAISSNFTTVGYVMLQPAATYTLLVTTDKVTDREVTVTMNSTAIAGSAHKIELTFSATAIEPAATLTGWKTDGTNTGTGTID